MRHKMDSFCKAVAIILISSMAAVAVAEESEAVDPYEGFNRAIYSFNDALDRNILLPVTKGYKVVTPDPVEKGVSNFFSNLGDVGVLFNQIFQFKLGGAAETTMRLATNTIIGLGGVLDVSSAIGLQKQDEDFGQTLGYWGFESGPYLVLPLLGPSNVRDGLGLIPDYYMDPVSYLEDDSARLSLQVIRVIDTRSRLMEAEKLISGDRYTFIRDAYMQRREHLVNDGVVSKKYAEDGF